MWPWLLGTDSSYLPLNDRPRTEASLSSNDDLWRLVQPLWDYLVLADTPRPSDVIFVFGSQDLAVAAQAASLYHDRYASRVLVTGSYGRMTRGVFEKPEALVFQDYLVSKGVPESAILTETVAANTLENVRLGIEVLQRSNQMPQTAILVAKGFAMRRCVATFAQQFENIEVRACPPNSGLVEAADRDQAEFAVRLAAELDRLDVYAAAGDIRRQDIPPAVRQLAQRIRTLVAS